MPQTPMPPRAHHIPPRRIAPDRSTRTVAALPFGDLVFLLAEGVADAQTALDAHAMETRETLSETTVDVVPTVNRTIDPGESVTTETTPAESRSLLELGITPAWYRFSESTVEVAIDITAADGSGSGDRTAKEAAEDWATNEAAEDRTTGGTTEERADRSLDLRADTEAGIDERRFDWEVGTNARLAVQLRPTPSPARLRPAGTTDVAPTDAVTGTAGATQPANGRTSSGGADHGN